MTSTPHKKANDTYLKMKWIDITWLLIFLKSHNISAYNLYLGGKNMRKLSEAEVLSLTSLLKMEQDGLIVQRAVNALITDENLKRQGESSTLACEGRIKGLQQFITENQVTVPGEV